MDRKNLPSYYTQEDLRIIKLFKEEMDRINLLYMKALQSNNITKANQLYKKIQNIANTLYENYWERADIKIPTEYIKWTSYIDNKDISVWKGLDKWEIKTILNELGPIHIEAVNALLNNSKNYVRSSLDWMERQALTMINEIQQEKVREQLAKWIIDWDWIFNMNKRVEQYFRENNITSFKDKWWKTWSMERYIDLLTRTETSIANVQWTINRALEVWITKFRIIERPDCCKECNHHHWEIVDIRDWVVDLPPFHPNCRWFIVMYDDLWEEISPREDNRITDNPVQKIKNNRKAKTPEERIKKALDIVENSTMYLNHEQSAIINMDWKIIRMASWLSGKVSTPRIDINEPFIFTHNHPNSSVFSDADLKNRIHYENEYWLRASSKIWTYSLYAERTIDKTIFRIKYNKFRRNAIKAGEADMGKFSDAWSSWTTKDYIKYKDWNIIYYKDDPLKFDKIIDEHYWKYQRELMQKVADDTPWVKFEFIKSNWIQKDTELNKMYLEKIDELDKLRKKKIKSYENGENIGINDYI